ncbi:MAG TPA: hypothetical protein VI454_11975 [Verrucomicrobiae bacterium]|jgi:hypothetical protein
MRASAQLARQVLFTATILAVLTTTSPTHASKLFLTGLADLPTGRLVMIYELPSGITYTLVPGRVTAGFQIESIDFHAGAALIKRGGGTFAVAFTNAEGRTNAYAEFLKTGDLPPDFEGEWPPGYEPRIIREHRAGRLSKTLASTSVGRGVGASHQFIAALEDYARTLPPGARAEFQNAASEFNSPSSDNGYRAQSPSPDTASPASKLVAAADFHSLSDEDARLLREILESAPPQLGTLTTDPGHIGRIDQLLWHQKPPEVRRRLELELLGYASPSSFNGRR